MRLTKREKEGMAVCLRTAYYALEPALEGAAGTQYAETLGSLSKNIKNLIRSLGEAKC